MSSVYTRDLAKFQEITPEEIAAIQALIELSPAINPIFQNVQNQIVIDMEAATVHLEKSIQKHIDEDNGKDPTMFLKTLFIMQTEFVHMRNIVSIGKKPFNPDDQKYIANEWAIITKDRKDYNDYLASRHPSKRQRQPKREPFAGF